VPASTGVSHAGRHAQSHPPESALFRRVLVRPGRATAPAASPGYGLIGMRERAQSAGGRLRAGDRPAGGFEVDAELPLHPQHPDQQQSA
jgi:hypothetical protein